MTKNHLYVVAVVSSIEVGGRKVYAPMRYYRDTRNEIGEHGGYSNIFSSSINLSHATMYDSYEDALSWKQEFLDKDETEFSNYCIVRI